MRNERNTLPGSDFPALDHPGQDGVLCNIHADGCAEGPRAVESFGMQKAPISRRHFALIAGSLAAAPRSPAQSAPPAPAQSAPPAGATGLVNRILSELGGESPANTADGFKAGDSSRPVKGIATTGMATMDVLTRAADAGTNLVITFEPTFFGRADGPSTGRGGGVAADDPVYKAKREFIDSKGLIVYRLRDRWQSRRQDDMLTGLAQSLGWEKYRVKAEDSLYDIPAATAEQVVANIRTRLNLRGGLRAVGDRAARVRRILLLPGVMTTTTMWTRYADSDLIVTGEVREWENTSFAADLFTAGEKHGLVTMGRVVSEDPGMRACSAWLKTVVKEVPVQFIGAGDPYWRAV